LALLATLLRRTGRDPRAALRRIIGDYELPAFPASVMNTLAMLRDPDCALAEIADQLQVDPGMNVRVLRMVNSAAFGLVQKVTNIHHGVTLLGRARLESLVLSCLVSSTLPARDISPGLSQARFWQVCARRACLARALGRHLHPSTEAESFTSALLQDMAVPVLASARPDRYPALIERALADPDRPLQALERAALGFDHAEVGALMVETWGLPAELGRAVAGHHGGEDGPAGEHAVRIAALLGYASGEDGSEAVRRICVERHGIDPERVEEMLATSHQEAARFSALLH